MTEGLNPVYFVLGSPLVAAALLALIPGRWQILASRLNALASLATLFAGSSLFLSRPLPTNFIFIDDFNIYLVVLTAFVGFTTSVFSASYIRHELDTGRLDGAKLRFYHAMYQAFLFTMLLALVANNLGVMWVAVEGATLTTALMISLYRTRESIEAAWKYFILCGVGIALALFGTILMYLAAQPVMGSGLEAMRGPRSSRR